MELGQILTERQIKDLEQLVQTAKGRKYLIEAISIAHDDNWQCVSTPYDIAGEMLDLIPKDAENYIVFFALEFLELLVKERGFDPEKILFVADNQIESDVANFYGCNAVILGKGTAINNKNMTNTVNGANMKFGTLAVVGNPPYQTSNDNGGETTHASALYNFFVESVIDALNPDYFSFIIPSRWMIGGRGLDSFRKRMMNDRHLKIIVDDMSCNGIFPTVDIAGGVNYFLWEKNHNGKCTFNGVDRVLDEEDIIIRENESRSILSKVKLCASSYIGSKVSQQTPYGIISSTQPSNTGTPCIFKRTIGQSFVDPSIVKNPRNDIHRWKVIAPKAPIAGQTDFSKAIKFFNETNIVIAMPGEVCTQTYLVINSFDTKYEAENFISYMKTKFFRFMLRMRVTSQDVSRDCYNWVPDMIDYSTEWTDKDTKTNKGLYSHFGLTRQEQAYIESKIKAI